MTTPREIRTKDLDRMFGKRIRYTPNLDIRNIDQLPRGTGARFLEVTNSHEPNVLIAVRWRRTEITDPGNHLVDFRN